MIFLFLLGTSFSYYSCFIQADTFSLNYANHEFSALKKELGAKYLDVNSTAVKSISQSKREVFHGEFKSLANFVAISGAIILGILGFGLKAWDYPDSLLLSIPTIIVFLFNGIDNLVMILSILISFSGISLGRRLLRKPK